MSVAIPSLRGAIAVPEWAKNELWRKAGAAPSLDLRFADLKSLVDAATGTSLVTFARASSGTYVGSDGLIKTATTNEPRFDHDPTTGESLGLLVEEARTNLFVRSEEFDNASWSLTNMTATANAVAFLGASATAESLLETAASGAHSITQSVTTSSARCTASFFVKANGRDRLAIAGASSLGGNLGTGVVFDLATDSYVSGAAAGAVASVRVLSNGWKRISYSWDASAATGVLGIFLVDSGVNTSYAGDTSKGIYIHGAQLEEGSFPTSYIPTTSSTVTRAADVAQITGTNFSSWYNQSEGSLFADCISNGGGPAGVFYPSVFWNSSFSQAFGVAAGKVGTGNSTPYAYVNGGNQSWQPYLALSIPNGGRIKSCLAGANNNMAYTANGIAPATTTAVTMPTGVNQASFSAYPLNGTISRLTYYPVRLPDATLQTITL